MVVLVDEDRYIDIFAKRKSMLTLKIPKRIITY